MGRRLIITITAALALAGGLVTTSAGTGAPGSDRSPVLSLKRVSRTDTASYNWGGYAVYKTNGAPMQFKDVSGSWTQPEGTCDKKSPRLAAFYVGIDGYNSSSVEQIGTDVDCSHGNPVYYAWYEMYPDPPVYLDTTQYPVEPGDSISARVKWNSGSSFTLTLSNGSDWTFSDTLNAPVEPERTSAEWIAEMPATGGHFWPLTDFGTVTFTDASVTNDATTSDIDESAWDHDKITIVKRGRGNTLACTGALQNGGSSFTIDYGSCP